MMFQSQQYLEICLSIDERIQNYYSEKIPYKITNVFLDKGTLLQLYRVSPENVKKMVRSILSMAISGYPILDDIHKRHCPIIYHGNLEDDLLAGRLYLCVHSHENHEYNLE